MLFCSILNSRLQTFLTEQNVLNKSDQIHATSQNHWSTPSTPSSRNTSTRTKTQSPRVSRKHFTQSGTSLFLKLLQKGIRGKIYDIIKTMYRTNECAVKIGNMETDFFPKSRGVKQDCSLSPTLFNIYFDDLAKSLDESEIPGFTLSQALRSNVYYSQMT